MPSAKFADVHDALLLELVADLGVEPLVDLATVEDRRLGAINGGDHAEEELP